jgi:glutamate-5-semialdehyde dehydrogenase
MPSTLLELGQRVRGAARALAASSDEVRSEALRQSADLLRSGAEAVLAANARDVAAAQRDGASAASLDRLVLTAARVESMARGMESVAALACPVGEVLATDRRPNGLRVERVRVPLGVIGVIYENRPNVTTDAAALCLKAANAAFLRGSGSALESNRAIAGVLRAGVVKVGLPEDAVVLVEDTSHETAIEFMQLRGIIDCLIPRGGPALVGAMLEHARVPYVLDGEGNCHVYVDASAPLDMAIAIVTNAKMQRPGVCNAAESLIVHADVAAAFLPRVAAALDGVGLVGDARACDLVHRMAPASEEDFATEFLGPTLSVAVVDDLDGAIAHISRYGSGHSEAIVTTDAAAAERFVREVDAAAVLVNASTRFVDGNELGLGAEVGISTQKLHARGPMGLAELTCVKWVVRGDGQVRS